MASQYLNMPDGVLYQARIRMQLTQKDLAKALGFHSMTVWKIENNRQQARGMNAVKVYDYLINHGCVDLANKCTFVTRVSPNRDPDNYPDDDSPDDMIHYPDDLIHD